MLNKIKSETGALPVLVLVSVLAFLSFFLITNTFGFKDELFAGLFPKPQSYASEKPANDKAKGLIYDGLEKNPTGPCKNLFEVKGNGDPKQKVHCTHGPDPVPVGINLETTAEPIPLQAVGTQIECDGDGNSGFRVQALYVRSSDVADRYTTYLPNFKQAIKDLDTVFNASAAETGGISHVRFVHDVNCDPIITPVVLSPTGDDSFGSRVSELQTQGYNRADRKYLIFMDANVYCGVASMATDDQPGASNRNNLGPSFAFADNRCWNGFTAAHEVMHNLGGVQFTAPNTSGGGHCVDDYDVMCYSDTPNFPAMQIKCPDSSHEQRFDCNHDDYFNTNPQTGNYLATHWNTVNNQFLLKAGSVPTPAPSAQPTVTPIATPVATPTAAPTAVPTVLPTATPSSNSVVISNITVTTTTTSATIKWTTNLPSTTKINYGLTQIVSSSLPEDTNLVTNHTVTLTGLASQTRYFYKVSSANSAGLVTSSLVQQFRTKNR